MRALVCHAYGPIDSLKVEDIASPEPKAGEVLVKVRAAGVSFAAMLGVQGKHQNKPPLPYVPGNELAGHVVALGEGVTNVAVGDRVATGVSRAPSPNTPRPLPRTSSRSPRSCPMPRRRIFRPCTPPPTAP